MAMAISTLVSTTNAKPSSLEANSGISRIAASVRSLSQSPGCSSLIYCFLTRTRSSNCSEGTAVLENLASADFSSIKSYLCRPNANENAHPLVRDAPTTSSDLIAREPYDTLWMCSETNFKGRCWGYGWDMAHNTCKTLGNNARNSKSLKMKPWVTCAFWRDVNCQGKARVVIGGRNTQELADLPAQDTAISSLKCSYDPRAARDIQPEQVESAPEQIASRDVPPGSIIMYTQHDFQGDNVWEFTMDKCHMIGNGVGFHGKSLVQFKGCHCRYYDSIGCGGMERWMGTIDSTQGTVYKRDLGPWEHMIGSFDCLIPGKTKRGHDIDSPLEHIREEAPVIPREDDHSAAGNTNVPDSTTSPVGATLELKTINLNDISADVGSTNNLQAGNMYVCTEKNHQGDCIWVETGLAVCWNWNNFVIKSLAQYPNAYCKFFTEKGCKPESYFFTLDSLDLQPPAGAALFDLGSFEGHLHSWACWGRPW